MYAYSPEQVNLAVEAHDKGPFLEDAHHSKKTNLRSSMKLRESEAAPPASSSMPALNYVGRMRSVGGTHSPYE